MNHFKHHFRNMLVDCASVVIVLAITFTVMQGFTVLYTSYYNARNMPSPGDFQSAGYQFTGAISLGYMLVLTRKHRKDLPELQESKTTETKTTTDTKTTVT